jgi:hypothetical protein
VIALALAVVLTCPCPKHHVHHQPSHLAVPVYAPKPCPPTPAPSLSPCCEKGWIEKHWWLFPIAGIATYAIVEHNEPHSTTNIVLPKPCTR